MEGGAVEEWNIEGGLGCYVVPMAL